VLAELVDGGRRYQELDEALDGVSHKVLTDTLRRAERDGLVVRHLDPGRVETATLYQITELGRSLVEPLALWRDGLTGTGPKSRQPANNGLAATTRSQNRIVVFDPSGTPGTCE
jgi:DNA-binding HxlR family transcriptional regulator